MPNLTWSYFVAFADKSKGLTTGIELESFETAVAEFATLGLDKELPQCVVIWPVPKPH